MNSDGKIVVEPIYNAIGEFNDFGYAVMQRDGAVGLLNQFGEEIIAPKFEDLKVLDSTLISVMDRERWMVVNLNGKVILRPGYEQVETLSPQYLAYSINKKWGLVDVNGNTIIQPKFNKISLFQNKFFKTEKESLLGLISAEGTEILKSHADDILVINDNLFFYKKNKHWGAVNGKGEFILPAQYQHFSKISDKFFKLVQDKEASLFSLANNQIIAIGKFEAYYAFSDDYIICRKNRRLGLLDKNGKLVLKPIFNEIQAYGENLFRTNFGGKWGLINTAQVIQIPFEFDYIAPMKDGYCVVIKDRKLGIANFNGEVIVQPEFENIELNGASAQARKDGGVSLLQFDEAGQVKDSSHFEKIFTIKVGNSQDALSAIPDRNSKNQYILENFEWFYAPQENKWGLRKLTDGSIQIEPTFHQIIILKELGLTIAGIEILEELDIDRTSYRYEMVYGLVNNKMGLVVKEVDLVDIRLSDFDNGGSVARCITVSGRHGLINRIGKVLCENFAYIGEFHNGLARTSMKGRLSGDMDPNYRSLGNVKEYMDSHLAYNKMTDYTTHDRKFNKEAGLICEDCQWGYVDTLGQIVIPTQYTFAKDFVNEVGIVECRGKWGMVSKDAKELLPCKYDEVGFLENTDNKILRIFKKDEKYGLIDTLGQLAVNLMYDDIGSFSEGRLAVKRNNLWGFVDRNGLTVIPCRFSQVQNFSEGMSAVKLGQKWGYIDKLGNVEINFQFFRAGNFRNGLAFAKNASEEFGYIDTSGNWEIKPQFTGAYDFQNGIARVKEWVGSVVKTGLINTKGEYILKPKFLTINEFNKKGLATVSFSNGRKWGLINQRGEIITALPFRRIGNFKEGLAWVHHKNGFGYINTSGQIVISTRFSKAGDFSEGLAYVQQDGHFGYIDKKGKIVIPPTFSRCMNFKDGKAVVFKGNKKAGLIDKEGNYLIEPSINRMIDFTEGRGLVKNEKTEFIFITEQARIYDGSYESAGKFQHGVAVVQVDGQWGIINQKGIEIIPPKYDKIEQFEDGFAKVHIKGFNGLTNLQGELIVQPDYEYISYAGEGLFRVEQGDKVGYFDIDGNWVWGLSE